jgi:hypothetical protein
MKIMHDKQEKILNLRKSQKKKQKENAKLTLE